MDPRTRLLLEGPPGRTILRLAWPNMLVMGAQSSIGLIETWYVSRLGTDALAGMALVFPAFMLLQMVSAGSVGGGILSTLSRALGADRRDHANAVVWAAVGVTLLLAGATTAAALAFGRDLYALLGGTGGALDAAVAYSTVVFAGAVPLWLFNSFSAVIRAQGNMAFPATVIVVGTVLLVPVSPVLIFGWGPVPALGIAGGGLAVVAYYVIGTAVLGWHIWSGQGVLTPSAKPPRLPLGATGEILRIGLASSISSLSTNATVALAMAAAAAASPSAVAGYGTAVRLEYLLIPLVFGLGAPTAAIVGTSVGAGDRARAVRVTWIAAGIAFAITEAIGFAAALFPARFLGLFTEDPAIVASGAAYLAVVGPAYGFFGAGLALYFAAQATGRLAIPLTASLVRVALVAALGGPAAHAFGPAGLYAVLAGAMVVYAGITASAVGRADDRRRIGAWRAMRRLGQA